MAISEDEAMLSGSEAEAEQESSKALSAKEKGKGKLLADDDAEPVPAAGAQAAHELDNLPWSVAMLSCQIFGTGTLPTRSRILQGREVSAKYTGRCCIACGHHFYQYAPCPAVLPVQVTS